MIIKISITKTILALILFNIVSINISAQQSSVQKIQYVCTPCGIKCDEEVFDAPGKCPICEMELVDKKTIKHKSVSPNELSNFLKLTNNLVLLDVRTKEEYNGQVKPNFGTLKNAINIPISDIENGGFQKLDKNATILVYCSHSHRSSRVSYLLTQNGFKNVINLLGGMSELKDKTLVQ